MKDKYPRPIYNAPPNTSEADDDEPQSTIDGVFNPEDMDELSVVDGKYQRTNERYVRRGQKPRTEEEELEKILREEGIDLPKIDD